MQQQLQTDWLPSANIIYLRAGGGKVVKSQDHTLHDIINVCEISLHWQLAEKEMEER